MKDRPNDRWEAEGWSLKIMAMVGDSGAEEPCLMGDVPPVSLLNCVCDFICVKHYNARTERSCLDWIKRFIHFHGKRHPPEVEADPWRLGRPE